MRAIWAVVLLAGCTGNNSPKWVANFTPPAPMAGYTRYVTPTVTDIEPGADVEYCQWVAAASATDKDVLAMTGVQSPTGHHAILYATTETNFKVGESHICTTQDMVQISFVGAIGGEGTAGTSAQLPDGLYYRLPAGQALMVNTHWLNATDGVVDGQAVVDVKFAAPSPDRVIADLFASNGDTFSIPSGQKGSYDVNCVLKQDLNLAMVANHMHTYGSTAYSELVHADGTKETLVQDATWSPERQFNPNYLRYTVDAPKLAHAGDTYHTHCEWNNTSGKTQQFPDEMCVGFAFYFPSQGQIICENGGWGM